MVSFVFTCLMQGVDDRPPGDREHCAAQGLGGGPDSDAEGRRQQTGCVCRYRKYILKIFE